MNSKILGCWGGVLIEGILVVGYSGTALAKPTVNGSNATQNPPIIIFNEEKSTERVELSSEHQVTGEVPGATTYLPVTSLLSQQPNPNNERFPQPQPSPTPLPPGSEQPIIPTPTPSPTSSPSSTTVQVEKIEVVGSTIFTPEELNPISQPLEGKAVSLEDLRGAADKITQLYLDRGYITSRAVLVDQAIENGVVQIRVLEGKLEKIEVEGTDRVDQNYIRDRVELGAGVPLNSGGLEDQLRLLRADPLFKNVEASLRAGSTVGQSILIVRVTEADPFEMSIGADNYSPPSIGSERFGTNISYRNLTGVGDKISASYYATATGGADIYDFSYLLPINPMNGTLLFRAAPNRNNVTQSPFNIFNIRGQSSLYDFSYRQPLVRTPREEFALSLGFTWQDGQTFTFAGPTPFGIGPDANGNSRTRTIKVGQDYLSRDVAGAWALRSLFSIGTGFFDATLNTHPIPDGRFFSWLGQIQRVQVLNEDNFLIAQADVQISANSLLPSQQFVIGGGQSLRGYRQNIRAGDGGIRFSLEDRITVDRDEAGGARIILAPFVDCGWIWNQADNPNNASLQSERFLAGAGMGVIIQPLPRLSIRIDYGLPLVPISDRGNNLQDSGLYFSFNYQL
jgi:hemolysin activation/secretion protein